MSSIPSMSPTLAVAAAVLATVLMAYVRSVLSWRARSRGRPLPPGPRGLPIIGNILDMPQSRPWEGLRDLCSKYGGMVCMKILGRPILFIGDAATAMDFMEKRAANSSDRNMTPSLFLSGHEWNFGFWRYGQAWRYHRRVFMQHFNSGAITKYRPVQRAAAHMFLVKLLENKSRLEQLITYTFSSVIMKIGYGIQVPDELDPVLAVIDEGVDSTRQLLVSGGFMVDHIHILRFVPSWFPGAGFQKKMAEWLRASYLLKDAPFERYMEAVKNDSRPPCIVTDIVSADTKNISFDPVDVAKNVAGVVFEAGSETTSSTMKTFFLAMSLYPDVQKKAQAELDAVVGTGRLPDWSDREALVHVNAIIKECLRWSPSIPLGISHCTSEDDELNGYFIPAGTIVATNGWACMRDPEAYQDPEAFHPERFIRDGKLDPKVRDPYAFAFGYGRRICPGREFGDAALFINISSTLHVFNITPALDENGKEIKIKPRMTDGLSSSPEDFRCTIKPRGAWAEALIHNVERIEA